MNTVQRKVQRQKKDSQGGGSGKDGEKRINRELGGKAQKGSSTPKCRVNLRAGKGKRTEKKVENKKKKRKKNMLSQRGGGGSWEQPRKMRNHKNQDYDRICGAESKRGG